MEKQWSCGCVEVGGQLAEECTQTQASGPLQSHQRIVYSPVCFRKRVVHEAEVHEDGLGAGSAPPLVATPEHIDIPATTEAADGVQE